VSTIELNPNDCAGFEFVLFGALGLLPTYGLGQGFSPQTTFNIIAILNAYVFTHQALTDLQLCHCSEQIANVRQGVCFREILLRIYL
jgi:hypothetical protein